MSLQLGFVGAYSSAPVVLAMDVTDGTLGGNAYYTNASSSDKANKKAGGLGKSGGSTDNTITFEVDMPCPDGFYTLRVFYMSGASDRYYNIRVNADGNYKLSCADSGGFDKTAETSIEIYLKSGKNTITFGSEWYAPDLDKIEILGSKNMISKTYGERDNHNFTCGNVTLMCDANNGIYSAVVNGNAVITDSEAAYTLRDSNSVITSSAYPKHTVESGDISDGFGRGILVKFIHSGENPTTLTQEFRLYEELDYFTTTVILSDENTVSSNYIAPIYNISENGIGSSGSDRLFLSSPYDNDAWIEPSFVSISSDSAASAVSHEVTAIIDKATGSAAVMGSLSHDAWKTGISMTCAEGKIFSFTVYGGAADNVTRDTSPHGYLSGNSIASPLIFIGSFDDWRNGLNEYGKANTVIQPKKESTIASVPFGYNSWGVLQDKVSYSDMIAVSDYIKDNLQDIWSGDEGDPVYVNIDSFWDYLAHNDAGSNIDQNNALRLFVAHCHENNQKAGIYYTPFACWHGDENSLRNTTVEGTDGKYAYYDIALRSSDGSALYGKLDGGYALDPTHPGTMARIKDRLEYFISLGFEYIKLDFMAHGSLEGSFYNSSVTTGTQAYNYGMAYINEIIGDKMFINLSIAPVFPYQYADGRRISCDAFSSIDNTRHVLSYITCCFWERELFNYTDPDHIVIWGSDGNVTEEEARSRVTSAMIAGTSYLAGDNFAAPVGDPTEAANRFTKLLANSDIVKTAKLGKIFMPLHIVESDKCSDIYYMINGSEAYLAVFNFSASERSFSIPSELFGTKYTNAAELWRGENIEFSDEMFSYALSPNDSAVFKLTSTAAPEESTTQSHSILPLIALLLLSVAILLTSVHLLKKRRRAF